MIHKNFGEKMRKRDIFLAIPIVVILIVTYIKYREIPYENYQDETLSEMQNHGDKLEKISSSYVKRNNIDEKLKRPFYDCVGEYIFTKDPNQKLLQVLDECKKEFDEKTQKSHFNISWIKKDFNRYDGSYSPLQKIIQKTIKEPKSYQHLATNYHFNFEDARPHMAVSIDYRAANIQGYMLTLNMSAKVDMKTKEIYDLK
jgi:hypothetical protein